MYRIDLSGILPKTYQYVNDFTLDQSVYPIETEFQFNELEVMSTVALSPGNFNQSQVHSTNFVFGFENINIIPGNSQYLMLYGSDKIRARLILPEIVTILPGTNWLFAAKCTGTNMSTFDYFIQAEAIFHLNLNNPYGKNLSNKGSG